MRGRPGVERPRSTRAILAAMAARPLVSVLVPAHRGHTYLLRESVPRLFACQAEIEVLLANTGAAGTAPELGGRVRTIEAGPEAGFCRAINGGIEASAGELVLFSNADLFLTERYVDELVAFLARRPEAAAAGGKILRYDLAVGRPTTVLDSTGLVVGRSRRAWDRGEGEPDVGRYETEEEVFGLSGAGLLVRRSALEHVRADGEYLDESFVAYKDDVDLAWRLRLAGLACWYVPSAVAYHARTSRGRGGRPYLLAPRAYHLAEAMKPQPVRERSLANQWLLLVKNEAPASAARDAPWILGRELLVLAYNLAVAPRTLAAVGSFARALPGALRKRRELSARRVVPSGQLRRRWIRTSRRPRSSRA